MKTSTKIIVLFGLILMSCNLLAQSQIRIFNVNFAYDKYELTLQEKAKLDSIFDIRNITQINLAGHTDSDGDNEYNLILSEKRVAEVRQYLTYAGMDARVITIGFFGENAPKIDNTTEAGKAENRRVEVRVFYEKEIEIIKEKPPIVIKKPIRKPIRKPVQKPVIEEDIPEEPPEPEQPKPKRDTILEVEDLQIVISKADYEKFKDCLMVSSTMTGEDAYRSEMITTTYEGTLISCGMASIRLSYPCEGCFDQPVKIRYRIPEASCDPCRNTRRLYSSNSGGSWSRSSGRVVKVRIDGEYFYEMIFSCPSSYNCDCRQDSLKQKFVLPKGYKLTSLNVVYDCPLVNYEFKEIKRNKTKGAHLSCPLKGKEGYVYLHAENKKGGFVTAERIPMNDLKHGIRKHCKVRFFKRIFRKKEENYLYKKYCISQEQIEKYQVKKLIYND